MKSNVFVRTGLALILAASSAAAQQEASSAGPTDHASVVGHWGATWFAPVALGTLQAGGNAAAPIGIGNSFVVPIGARYWASSSMGYDLGVGFLYNSGSSSKTVGGQTTTTDNPSAFGMVLHGGVPFALATAKHYTFIVVPEANLGFASSSAKATGGDITGSGFHLDIGARAGAEVQFGFIGIPHLSLQASVGAALALDRTSVKTGNNEDTASSLGIGTTVQNDPWNIFRTTVAALYYF